MKCIGNKCGLFTPVDNDADCCVVFNEVYEIKNNICLIADHIWDIKRQLERAKRMEDMVLICNGLKEGNYD